MNQTNNHNNKPIFKPQGPKAYVDFFVRYPENVYNRILFSNLPIQAKEILAVVVRLTFGYGEKSCFFDWTALVPFVTGHKLKVNQTIKWLIELNILKGGPVKYKSGKKGISTWELSINQNVSEWDLAQDKDKLDSYRELEKTIITLKNSRQDDEKQANQRKLAKQTTEMQSGCEYDPGGRNLGYKLTQIFL